MPTPKYKVRPDTGELQEYIFEYNGILALKNFVARVDGERLILHSAEDMNFSILDALVSEVEINGVVYDNADAAQQALQRLTFNTNRPVIMTQRERDLLLGALQSGNYVGTAADLKALIDTKVDKEDGKGLSANDFTNAYKQRLDNLEDYDIELDENTTELRFKKGSNVVRRISLMFLDDEGTKLVYNKPEKTLELRDKRNNLLTSIPVSHFVSNIPDGIVVQNGKIKLMAGNNVLFENAFSYNDLADKPDLNFAPASHRHNWDDIDGKPDFNYLSLTGGTVNGDITANSIIKKNSSNDKVLLGGGGDINLSELKNDNVKIGGRNLALNTGSIGEINISNTSQAANHGLRYIMEKLQKDELCMLSFDARTELPNTKSLLHIESYGDNSTVPGQRFVEVKGDKYKRYSVYVKLLDISNKNLFVWLTEKESNVLIKDFKLYRGTQIEDWSPAPEDIRIATEISGVRQILPHENIVYATANTNNCDLQLIPSGYSVAFRKVFAGGQVTFTCLGKQIIYTGDNAFNGGDGSTAVVSIWNNKCYIDIRNI